MTNQSTSLKYLPRLLVTVAWILLLTSCESAIDPLTISSTQFKFDRDGANGKSWQAAFDLGVTPSAVEISLRVRLVPGPDITRPQLERLMRQWEPAVESIWSDKCNLLINGRRLPLRLDLRFDSATPHHTVIVRNNAVSRVDQLNWSRYSSARVIAHEIGHMLGAYDEYPGGAQNPDAERVDPQSIMGGSPGVTADVAAHHFELIESWVQGFTQDARITTMTTGS